MRSTENQPARTNALGRVLIMVYVVLAIAATARAAYQFIAKFEEAPLAYSLSLVAGVVYIVAAIALMLRRGLWRQVAWAALLFETSGVLIVGLLSLLVPALFAHDSVWSHFGAGYLFIPLVLPVLGMYWLATEGRELKFSQARAAEAAGAVETVRSEARVSSQRMEADH